MTSDIASRAKQNLDKANKAQTPRQLIESMIPQFQMAMPKGAEASQLARDALTVLSSNPALASLRDPTSFLGALMTCAQLGLRPGVGALGQAYIIPFKGKAQFILGYQGMIELANRSGQIAAISAHAVHENDEFSLEYGIEDKLIHRPQIKGPRGAVYGYYAVGKRTNGGYSFVYMSREECEEHRDKFALSQNGPWKAHFDQMALKTVIRKLFTFLPRSTEIQNAIVSDATTRVDIRPDADLADVSEPVAPDEAEIVDEGGSSYSTATGAEYVQGEYAPSPEPFPND